MKDKRDDNKKESEIDYEKLYYQAMKENVLMKDKKITFEFNEAEINFLRNVMFEELLDMKFEITSYNDEDEDAEDKKLGKVKRDAFLNEMIDSKKEIIEQIIKKLRFEL